MFFSSKKLEPILPTNNESMKGAGISHGSKRYITHTTLDHSVSALTTFSLGQKIFIVFILMLVVCSFILWPLNTLRIVVALMSFAYFADIFFNIIIISRSLKYPPEIVMTKEETGQLTDEELPVYTILCPLYKEAHVLPQFVESISKLDWPSHKLDVQLILEEDDTSTIDAAKSMNLPDSFRIMVVPHSLPKTKPKACNYGLAHAKGEYLVIYDAEDKPERDQLKKAYLAFKTLPASVKCLQAKLNYFNPWQNLLTRLFTIEYSLWFDVILPGYQHAGTIIPLGGTSNHFRTKDLHDFLGWDPFNVTEDCDLGVRLFKRGYRTAIIDSVTYEEANSNLGNWVRQRSRWIKGYMQTFLVHMRDPWNFFRTQSRHALFFQLIVGGKIAFMLINPIMWLLTISYFVLYAYVGPAIESLYPGVIFGMAFTSLIFGNFLFLFSYMIGVAKRREWQLMIFVFLQPFYWLAVSYAALIAIYQLIIKPHYWEKTVHGLDGKKAPVTDRVPVRQHAASLAYASSLFGAYGLNFAYNLYLTHTVPMSELGALTLIGTFLAIIQIVSVSLGRSISYHIGYIWGKLKQIDNLFWRKTSTKVVFLAALTALVYYFVSPQLAVYFQTSEAVIQSFVPVIFFGLLLAVDTGYLSGQQKFVTLAWIILGEALLKLALTILMARQGRGDLIMYALPLSMAAIYLIQKLFVRSASSAAKGNLLAQQLNSPFPWRFFSSAFVSKLSILGFLSLDMIFAKHFLSPESAGQYALISLIGKGIFFAGNWATSLITPLAAKESGESSSSKPQAIIYVYLSWITTLLAMAVVVLGAKLVIPIIFGDKAVMLYPYLTNYTYGVAAYTIASTLVAYYQAKNLHLYSYIGLGLSAIQAIFFIVWHQGIGDIVRVVFVTGILQGISVLGLSLVKLHAKSLAAFVQDFGALFSSYEHKNAPPESLKILIFNWRDTRHAWAGGAETYVHEIAKEWVKSGHRVTLFCGNDGNLPRNEVVDGVQVIRRGGLYTVYFWAFVYYVTRLRGIFDIVIDCENGIPFFTPFYVGVPKFLLIFHIHQQIFREHLRTPLRQIAQFLEGSLMPAVYHNQQVVTISPSTHDEIISLGLTKKRKLQIVTPGLRQRYFVSVAKTHYPSFVYIGRLKRYKNVDIAIRAFAKILVKSPEARLTIAGSGDASPSLKALVRKLKVENSVNFAGHITESHKRLLLATSWAALQPSSYEGWGLTVIEANAAGTPVIASNVPGLRDTILPNVTGILVARRSVDELGRAMLTMIEDSSQRMRLGEAAQSWAKRFRWDTSADKFLRHVYLDLRKA